MKLFDEPVFSKKKKKEKKITGWNAAKRHILCGARSRVLKSPISPKRYRNEERAGNDFDPRRLLQPDKRKHPCPPLNLHFPQASKNLRTSFFSQKTTLIARPSSAVSHDQKACRSTKYACTYIPRGPSARPVHAAGSLRKWACFLSTSPLGILRIIMNEKKEKKKKKKEKKRKERGKKLHVAGFDEVAKLLVQEPYLPRPLFREAWYRMTLSSHASVAHSSGRSTTEAESWTTLSPLSKHLPFLPHPLLRRGPIRTADKISARLSARANRKLHG